ncbi:FecR family protein [Chitinophaga sp. GCM10012297]|uniref:FecR domain-containing protein n=1 Tax=Chitinophaga chungangae TaxID=2821488 RepID=A0ABS3YK06_9BACT|nr:FecR family protein [Chitinophaga chungangae]MBO9154780.1 FecR domain-containing protein [Chitinophaga chungangae]
MDFKDFNNGDIVSILFRLAAEEELTAEERAKLDAWLNASAYNRLVLEEAQSPALLRERLRSLENTDGQALFEKTFPEMAAPVVRRMPLYRRWWAAASVLLLLFAGGYFLLKPGHSSTPDIAVAPPPVDIMPGKKGAVLTLADGREVVLDSLGNGIIANQNGTQAVLDNGKLAYNDAGESSGEIQYNKTTTPRGRQFRLQLPDGTLVWLNAESSIRYPTAFEGSDRKVEITGEAYFEVAKNVQKPFLVSINNQTEVEVLGTHFNVNAYPNENSRNTTLFEGAVRVYGKNGPAVLKPGQQAQVTATGDLAVVNGTDLDKAIAWKNGVFNFRGSTLEEVMRQLARWYDIEIIYEGKVPSRRFNGEIGMDLSLAQVLKGLSVMQVNFRIEEGKRLVVMP